MRFLQARKLHGRSNMTNQTSIKPAMLIAMILGLALIVALATAVWIVAFSPYAQTTEPMIGAMEGMAAE